MKNTLRIALGAALLWSAAGQAEIFVGAGLGSASIDDSGNASGVPVSMDDTDMGWKFYGGMMITDNFGFEAGYTDLGSMSQGAVNLETDTFYAAGVAALPIGEDFSIYGKVGAAFWDQNINTLSYDGTDLMTGIGAKYRFADQFHVRVEWERYGSKLETDFISAGLGLQF
ncbi:MAG: outer membrane beta-barrel protein [Gammaproteobacteria bacterium]|nr:outer membrane beta-barrel protein [Gammaproteobacteria bacterium]